MGRPKKTIQRKPSGIFQVILWIDGRRHYKSLETKDEMVATKRAAQAIRELQAEAQRASTQGSKWDADTPVTEWDIPTLPDGSNDYANAVEKKVVWSQVAEPEQIRGKEWRDLVNEAVSVRKRKTGKDYSHQWYEMNRIAMKKVPFSLSEANPQLIREWMQQMQAEGLGGRTIEINCGALKSLIKVSIKSGYLVGYQNPFELVDFTSNDSKPIYTAVEEDYRKLRDLLPTLEKRVRIPVLLQVYLGTRISELRRRKPEDFDLENCTMQVVEGTAKNKHSVRTVPIPQFLADEIADGFEFDWPVTNTVNNKTKSLNEQLTTHSFRHGLIRLGRDLKLEPDPIEAAVGHSLGTMKDRYGDGYSTDALRAAMTPIWEQLDQWLR